MKERLRWELGDGVNRLHNLVADIFATNPEKLLKQYKQLIGEEKDAISKREILENVLTARKIDFKPYTPKPSRRSKRK